MNENVPKLERGGRDGHTHENRLLRDEEEINKIKRNQKKNNYPTTIPYQKRMQPRTHRSKGVFCWGPPLARGPHPSRTAPRRLDEEPGQQTIRLRGKFKEGGGDLQGLRLFVVCVEVF
ncbi:hypothetical protein NPIL_107331 [Nephila pilipes]|uniref:Uncharacterized protein n=1 Tax=Nephila pilipes TaxID=299642 RepID=A0A8X6P0T1_NEPPI|nr:hypothetical protein NPIL_107331 [Nephila pilipes]